MCPHNEMITIFIKNFKSVLQVHAYLIFIRLFNRHPNCKFIKFNFTVAFGAYNTKEFNKQWEYLSFDASIFLPSKSISFIKVFNWSLDVLKPKFLITSPNSSKFKQDYFGFGWDQIIFFMLPNVILLSPFLSYIKNASR